jgi:hypothetical protein
MRSGSYVTGGVILACPRAGWRCRTTPYVLTGCLLATTPTVHSGGSARDYLPGFAWFGAPVMVQRASGCPYVYSAAPSV